jgi:hypothetical protein
MQFFKSFLLFAVCCLLITPSALADFTSAAQLLKAARAGDTRAVESLVRAGADVNYVDNTGLSVVCTAIMNNDIRAAQVLQIYGADASRCDQQIKRYRAAQSTGSRETDGFFSGLSTPQNMTLLAGGAALVVGGVVLLSSMSGNDNGNSGGGNNGGGHGGGGGGGGGTTPGGTAGANLPYGPAMPTAADESANYTNNLDFYSADSDTSTEWDFAFMSGKYADPTQANYGQTIADPTQPNYKQNNYLLMMHGYSPLARGYNGRAVFRTGAGHAPAAIENPSSHPGGKPVQVALITNNGINPTGSAARGDLAYADAPGGSYNTTTIDKYLNYNPGGGTEKDGFDFSSSGSVFNQNSTESDLAKIIAGWEAGGRAAGDFYGFMPNGQLAIYRTGGGYGLNSITPGAPIGTLNDVNANGQWDTGDQFVYMGITFTITKTGNNFVADGTAGGCTPSSTWDCKINGYTGGTDSYVYADANSDGIIDTAYSVDAGGDVIVAKERGRIDYMNYSAMRAAAIQSPLVIANAALLPELKLSNSANIRDMTAADRTSFLALINYYYDAENSTAMTSDSQGYYADRLFSDLATASHSTSLPMLIFGAGEYKVGVDALTPPPASFENAAPLFYPGLEHKFMSVVAVMHQNGTGGYSSVSGYETSDTNKIVLAQHTDAATGETYGARTCGATGRGTSSIDPWCFAAAGNTAEQAVASMAGAVGVLRGAFDYMTNEQIFLMMALTADGAFLHPNVLGTGSTTETLLNHLKTMYALPADYQFRVDNGEDYFAVFKEVFGYGLINLERATTPTSKIYYYDGNNIVSSGGNAYWSRAASRTKLSLSGAFGARSAVVNVPVFDILESADSSMQLPRVFENSFALDGGGRRGIFLGDALGDFVTEIADSSQQIAEKFSFNMKFSESNRVSNMSGLDELSFGYRAGAWSFGAEYKHHFNDRAGVVLRGEASNPVLSLASNAMATSATFGDGAWSFGARAFSGQITDQQLLENDPMLTGQYEPLQLGTMHGAESSVNYNSGKFGFGFGVGMTRESDTLLGAYSDGLLGLGGGDTIYIDSVFNFAPTDSLTLTARATFANTKANPVGAAVMGLSDIDSNAFYLGADWGGLSVGVSRPLAVSSGRMQYATMDYEMIEVENGFALDTTPYIADLDLSADTRETRFSLAYRAQLGESTTGALGFVYRVNPDNTDEFGNESILMLKVRHSIGI